MSVFNVCGIDKKIEKLLKLNENNDYQTDAEFKSVCDLEEAINKCYDEFFDEKGERYI